MRPILIGCLATTTVLVATLIGCKKEEQPAQNPQGWQQTQPAAQPTAQPAAYPTAQPAATPAATAAPAPATGGMNPNPTGLACTTDQQCLTHKCNTQLQKCSFPCLSNADCVAGMACTATICGPAIPGVTPAAQ